jgi:hypothetical protein
LRAIEFHSQNFPTLPHQKTNPMNTILKPILTLMISINLLACTTNVKTGDGSNKVEQEGTEGKEQRKVGDFNMIEIDGVFNVNISQGSETGLSVEGDKAILEHIITEVEGNTLILKMEDDTDFGDIDPIHINVQVTDLSSVKTTGVGKVESAGFLKFDQFQLTSEGVGAIDLKLSANKLVVKSSSVGAITLAGKVKEADITHNGVGVLQAFELLTQNLTLSSNGIGAAEVYASESIAIDAKGVGSVQYKGNPTIKNIKSEGIGKVSAVD